MVQRPLSCKYFASETVSVSGVGVGSGSGLGSELRTVTVTVLIAVPLSPVTVNWNWYTPGVVGVSNVAVGVFAPDSVIGLPGSGSHKYVSIAPIDCDPSNVICACSPIVTD